MNRTHLLEDTRERIERDIAAGFASRESIVDMAIAYMRDDPDNEYPTVVLRRVAGQMTDELLDEHYRRQEQWAYPTDCDRLDEAFEEMTQIGIIARQNYSVGGMWAPAAIRQEAARIPGAIGYVFFHKQDTDAALENGTLYLSYGSMDATEENGLAIGHRIVSLLRLVGLQTDWNGDIRRRIGVVNLDWKRRRP